MTSLDHSALYNGATTLFKAIFEFWHLSTPIDIFPYLAITFFVYKLIRFHLVKASIEDALLSGIAHLHPFKRNQGEELDTVQKISQALQGKHLSTLWIEFKESLVVAVDGDHKKYRNTLDSEHFFNYQSICKKFDFFSSVPGILTGMAILGTFVGIIYGMQSSDIAHAIQNTNVDGGTKQFEVAIGNFLAAMGAAFGASVWGLALALIFTFVERKSVSNIDQLISSFNSRIDMIFPRQTSEDLLIRLVGDSQSQLAALNSISNDLPGKIVGCLTDGGVSKVEINSGVQKGIQAGFEGLGRRLAELNEFHDKYFAEVKSLFDNLRVVSDGVKEATNANRSMAESSKAAMETLKVTSESIEKASSVNGKMLDGIKVQAAEIEQVTEKFRVAGSDIGNMANTLTNASQYLVGEVKKSAEVFGEHSRTLATTATTTSDGLKSGFKAIDQHMGSVVTQLGGVVGGVNTYLENLVEKLGEMESMLASKGDKGEIGRLAKDLLEIKQAIDTDRKERAG